jgi:N-acetyl-anhydromuramyl-L-alanine amidase AmpD
MEGISELAVITRPLRTPSARAEPRPYGLVVHTTGGGIVRQALERKKDPLQHAVDYYATPKADPKDDAYPHYVCGFDGKLVQVTNETRRAPHVGFVDQRPTYMQADWETKLPVQVARLWRRAWPAYPSPAHLFPGTSVNAAYVGLELLHLTDDIAEPAFPGSTFTQAQHQMVVLLARDIAERWAWPKGWMMGSRLLGHEDLNPLTRSDKNGGWDPGALRAMPRFAWRWVRAICDGQDPGAISP